MSLFSHHFFYWLWFWRLSIQVWHLFMRHFFCGIRFLSLSSSWFVSCSSYSFTFFRRRRRLVVVLSLFIRAGVCFMYETEISMYTAQSLCNLMLHMGHISMKYFCHILSVLCLSAQEYTCMYTFALDPLERCTFGRRATEAWNSETKRDRSGWVSKTDRSKNLREKMRTKPFFLVHFKSTIYLKNVCAISTEDITTFWINCKRERKLFWNVLAPYLVAPSLVLVCVFVCVREIDTRIKYTLAQRRRHRRRRTKVKKNAHSTQTHAYAENHAHLDIVDVHTTHEHTHIGFSK